MTRSAPGLLARLAEAAALAAAGLAVLATAAGAAVIEIGDQGEVVVHDRPEVYLTDDLRARPIPRPEPPTAAIRDGAPSADRAETRRLLAEAAAREGLSPVLVEAVAWQESHMRQDSRSPKGAIGVMQLMPATARGLGVDPLDARANIRGGAAYLRQLLQRYHGDVVRALAAYNASPNAVDRYGGPPPYPETRAYVTAVLERLAQAGMAAP